MAMDEHGVKKKKERSSEAFIVVRPPPSKTNHPLNLQVQLVPPHSRDNNRSASSRRSSDDAASLNETNMEPLVRTTSNRSEVSAYSGYSTSQASISSVSSTSSGRRMIIPLYNLQAHNVMTNVVVDAGTDAKVAKFMKRGLEVIGLAVLEPMEVWGHGQGTGLPMMSPGNAQTNFDGLEHIAPNTPGSSIISLSSAGHQPPPVIAQSVSTTPTVLTLAPPQPNGAKRFFGKLFKKKEESSFPNSPTSATSPYLHPDVDRAVRQPTKRNSLLVPSIHTPEPSSAITPTSPQSVVLQPPVLGVQPTLNATAFPPRGRPTAYIWTVTRWLKGTPDNLLGGVRGMFASDRREEAVELDEIVEVRFEWTRGKSGDKKRRRDDNGTEATDLGENFSSRRSSTALTISNPPSTSSLNHQGEVQQHQPSQQKRSSVRPRSVDSQRSSSPPTATEEGEDGDQSDPEDSETPWTCNVIVRRIVPGSRIRHRISASAISPGHDVIQSQQLLGQQQSQQIKLKVATVSPTPHHPKVVSLLKIPFPLPDIEVANVRLRKRIITPAGVARPATSSGLPTGIKSPSMFGNKEPMRHVEEGLILTAEEIKDIVATTGLWLVVREAMGGVGKVSRRGDGWKIRG